MFPDSLLEPAREWMGFLKVIDPLTLVTKENVDSYAENWKKWLKK